ncbi:putative mitochondrial F1F0-ATP synthase g subunit [Lindgomyces ingoldianus]|uniref:Mitochondrial F1F0-ATP synthase g subunit n=1 Tax=Lindgomyces ingoldianus TaxID=673940 RepID=A0ACB6RAM3_9PLEO|nr:putative mitochondrial F1F0-ATP synthase g subunit [Lindgomyces ingoldianus]KAF2476100.1 putative mitochondrial F1F0-ATP synthase g subunit [Lindgomyces ingoldianus]
MSLAASRTVLRYSKFAARRAGMRNASSTSEVAAAAKEKTSNLQSKASEGLSRMTSSASSALTKAGSATAGALGNVGGRTGRLIGGIQSMIPYIVYYSKVGLELGKLVAQQRKMSPPDLATFQSYFQPVINGLRNPATLLAQTSTSSALQPANILNRLRNLSMAQWASAGVVSAEVIGFFTVGQMIGRFKIVGYRSSAPAHH